MPNTDLRVHPFTAGALGLAPFRLASVEKGPLTGCDLCGTAIKIRCWVESADGKLHKIGTDCIRKLGKEWDTNLQTDVERCRYEIERDAREKRNAAKREKVWRERGALRDRLRTILDADPALWTDRPHPFIAEMTRRDYAEFCVANAGGGQLQHLLTELDARIPQRGETT